METELDITALEFLGPLNTLLYRGDEIYQRYMKGGKKFLYAKILKDNNERIRQLIIEKAYLLPLGQHQHAIALLTHIDVWHALWETLAASKSHSPDDEFVFENDVAFPKSAVEALKLFYVTLKCSEQDANASEAFQ